MSDLSPQPGPAPSPDEWRRRRGALARKWAYVLAGIGYVPLLQAEFEAELDGLLAALCESVHAGPERTGPAQAAGARLVELNCASAQSLTATMGILGRGLLALPEFQPADAWAARVVGALGALAVGVSSAAQQATLAQQESMKHSLLKAVRDAKWNLRAAEARFEEVATSSASGILITDLDGVLVTVNAAVGVMLGRSPDELTGRNLFDLVPPERVASLREDYASLRDGRVARIKQSHRLLDADGEEVPVSLTASLLRGTEEAPSHFVTVIEDGTELILLQNELSRQALHDVLTGLPNRQYFSTQLETVLRQADPRYGVTLLQLELDGFAVVRDGLGDRVAEALLVVTAQRLKAALSGERALVARFGPAEFAVLVENSPNSPDPVRLVHELRRELAEPTYVDGHGLAASVSVGVVHRPARDREAAELLREAHQALRRAKASGHGQWELSHPEQNRRDREADALAAVMPGAFEQGAVQARYRPLIRLADETVHGVEVLLSWDHPDLGPLPDRRCRELAEATGLMLPLGEWLLRTGCQQTGWWRQRLSRDLRLVLSLTPHQAADAELLTKVVGVLTDTAFPAQRLLIELPALALATDLGEARDNLTALADLGVRPVLRDFGLGCANLAAVRELAVPGVRLDTALFGQAAPDSPVTDLLRELPDLARRAGAELIVDGVDTAEQAEFWLAAGAGLALGEHYGSASRPDELAAAFAEPGWRGGA